MTVQELIDALEELVEENYRENVEVRLAFQPSWPFEYDVTRAVVAQDDDGEEVLYLGEGGQLGYLPHKPAVALGWAEQHEDEDEDEDEEA